MVLLAAILCIVFWALIVIACGTSNIKVTIVVLSILIFEAVIVTPTSLFLYMLLS